MTKNEALRAGLYARVSSEQQARENTIGSQVEALRERIKEDGLPITPPVWAAWPSYGWPGRCQNPACRRLPPHRRGFLPGTHATPAPLG